MFCSIHGPYSQLNPVKWLANVGGVALVIGSLLMIKNRLVRPKPIRSALQRLVSVWDLFSGLASPVC